MATRRRKLQIKPNLGPRLGTVGPACRLSTSNSPRKDVKLSEFKINSPSHRKEAVFASEEEVIAKIQSVTEDKKVSTRRSIGQLSVIEKEIGANISNSDKLTKSKGGPQTIFSNVITVLKEKEKSKTRNVLASNQVEEKITGVTSPKQVLPQAIKKRLKGDIDENLVFQDSSVSETASQFKARKTNKTSDACKKTSPSKVLNAKEKTDELQNINPVLDIGIKAVIIDSENKQEINISRFEKKKKIGLIVKSPFKCSESPLKKSTDRTVRMSVDNDATCIEKPVEATPKSKPFRSRFPKAIPNLASAGRPKARSVETSSEKEDAKLVESSVDESVSRKPEPVTIEICSSAKIQPSKEVVKKSHPPKLIISPVKSLAPHPVPNEPLPNNTEPSSLKRERMSSTSTSEVSVKIKKRKPTSFLNSEVIDRCKLTMRDLIYWNPQNNPMKQSPVKEKRKGTLTQTAVSVAQSETSTITTNTNATDLSASHGDTAMEPLSDNDEMNDGTPVPQVKIGPDGNIILNEESLVVENPDTGRKSSDTEVINETDTCVSYASYRRKISSKRWTEQETLKFYRILSYVGTDFTLMQKLFPKRTHRELKNKFKAEEKRNHLLIDKAMRATKSIDKALFQNVEADEEEQPKPKKKRKASKPSKSKAKSKSGPATQKSSVAKSNKKPKARSRKKINYYEGSDSEIEEARQRTRNMMSRNEIGVAVPGGMMYTNDEADSRPGTVVCDGEVSCDDEYVFRDDTELAKCVLSLRTDVTTEKVLLRKGSPENQSSEISFENEISDESDTVDNQTTGASVENEPNDPQVTNQSDPDDTSDSLGEIAADDSKFILYDSSGNVEKHVDHEHVDRENDDGEKNVSNVMTQNTDSAQMAVGDGQFITIPKIGTSECYVLVTVLPANQSEESVMHVYKLQPSGNAEQSTLEHGSSSAEDDKSKKASTSPMVQIDLKNTVTSADRQVLENVTSPHSGSFMHQQLKRNVAMFSDFAVVSRSDSESLEGSSKTENGASEISNEKNISPSRFGCTEQLTMLSPAHSGSSVQSKYSFCAPNLTLGKPLTRHSNSLEHVTLQESDEVLDLTIPKKSTATPMSSSPWTESEPSLIVIPDEMPSEGTAIKSLRDVRMNLTPDIMIIDEDSN